MGKGVSAGDKEKPKSDTAQENDPSMMGRFFRMEKQVRAFFLNYLMFHDSHILIIVILAIA